MLFALIDCWRYFNRRGRYSPEAMKADGFNLATEDNFPDYKSYPLGHMAFVSTSNSFPSWVIMYLGNGAISHVTMFYGDGILHDCITSGIARRSFSEYFDGRSYISVVPPPPSTDFVYAKNCMDNTIGAGYNWFGVFRLGINTIIGNDHRQRSSSVLESLH